MYTRRGSGQAWMQPLVHGDDELVWPNSAKLVRVSSVEDPALATFCEPERRRRVWPSDEDNDNYYAERDIDRRASEFIDKVHRGMLIAGGEQDG